MLQEVVEDRVISDERASQIIFCHERCREREKEIVPVYPSECLLPVKDIRQNWSWILLNAFYVSSKSSSKQMVILFPYPETCSLDVVWLLKPAS